MLTTISSEKQKTNPKIFYICFNIRIKRNKKRPQWKNKKKKTHKIIWISIFFSKRKEYYPFYGESPNIKHKMEYTIC